MAVSWTEQDVADAIRLVSRKATTDKDFRKLVLASPHEAIKKVSGKDVPAGFKLKVIENSPGVDQTYVLPDFRGRELSEDELEKVAGGICAIEKCNLVACAADSG